MMFTQRQYKIRKFALTKYLSVLLLLLIFTIGGPTVFANTEGEQVDNSSSLFEFSAGIKLQDIKDGTAPFDANDQEGNDSGPNNNIVRSFDTITYPVKITINPKRDPSLKNIRLKFSGHIENGVSDNRLNANFAVGGSSSIEDERVSFEQFYTVENTGNSVMVPIAIDVQGAEPGVELRPVIAVEVLSVDGKDVSGDNVAVVFDELPAVKVSAKVNVSLNLSQGFTGGMGGEMSYRAIRKDLPEDDVSMLYQMGVSFNAVPLAGKSDLRGTTSPTGKLNYRFDITGEVIYDGSTPNEQFNFSTKQTPLRLFNYYDISTTSTRVGSKNTMSEEDLVSYTFGHHIRHSVGQSKMTNINNAATVASQKDNRVWDSGEWYIDKATLSNNSTITLRGYNQDYIVGSTSPIYRADGWSGARAYGVNTRAFSTQGFLFWSANEYSTINGRLNPNKLTNNVYYRVRITLESYEDKDGNVFPVNRSASTTFTQRNNTSGSFSINNTFFSAEGRELGTPVIGDSTVSKGDATVILGQNVRYQGYLYSHNIGYGGMTALFRWNSDSLELTRANAANAKATILNYGYRNIEGGMTRNDAENQFIYFGVAKSDDMSFQAITTRYKDDFDWFESYDDAVAMGPISAIMNDVRTVTGNSTVLGPGGFPLTVRTKKIGSVNEKGTHNILSTYGYFYLDAERKQEFIMSNRTLTRPTTYNDLGELIQKQAPVGGSVNFETLGIMNAQTAINTTSNKATYYNSERVNWRVSSSIVFPENGEINNETSRITIKQTLDKGLSYVIGSGQLNNTRNDPTITRLADGRTELVWTYNLRIDNKNIPDVTYQTTINPMALGAGVQSSQNVVSVIESPLDQRQEHLRRRTTTISVIKVGMVGVFETINKEFGEKNSEYVLSITPYTTIEDERDVKGVTVLPYNNDRLGSKFSGTSVLQQVNITGTKTQNDIDIYITDQRILETNPNKIDLTKNNWRKVTDLNNAALLRSAQTVLFHVRDLMSKDDTIKLDLVMHTANNNFGDKYINSTTLNSGTDYKLSPESNRVQYLIRADAELSFSYIGIQTGRATDKLTGTLSVDKTIVNSRANTDTVRVSIIDKELNKRVFSKDYSIESLPATISFDIDSDLVKNKHKRYEAVFENYNSNRIYPLEPGNIINTDGYTSNEGHYSLGLNASSDRVYRGVILSERYLGEDIVNHYETIDVSGLRSLRTKSGYGVDLSQAFDLTYSNDLMQSYFVDLELTMNQELLDMNSNNNNRNSELLTVPLHRLDQESNSMRLTKARYELPRLKMVRRTGEIYFEDDAALDSYDADDIIDAGTQLFVPIWLDKNTDLSNELSSDLLFETSAPVGVNHVTFDIESQIEIYAQMFGTIDSPTIKDDEIIVAPVLVELSEYRLDGIFTPEEIEWLKADF